MTGPSGSSDPVLLLHGQPGAARDWDRVVAALGDRVPTIAIDRPGWDGNSAARDVAGNARAAIDALDAHGVTRATVVGHSFGGAVAAWMAVEHAYRVSGLVLVAPAANVASLYALDRLLAAPVAGEFGSLLVVGAPALALRTPVTRRLIASRLGLSADHLKSVGRTFGRPAALRAFTTEQRSLVRDLPLLETQLPTIDVPTAVMVGARDLIVPLQSAEELVRTIPTAQLTVVPRAGHLLPLRHAPQVADTIVALRGSTVR